MPATTDCQGLARAIPELGPGYGDVQYIASDRYILGVRVVGRALLSLMPFDTMARTLRGIAFALLGVARRAGAVEVSRRAGHRSRRFAAGYLIIAVCLALLYGVHYFDAKLYFAPPDHVHFVFIIISLLTPLAHMRPCRARALCGELRQPDRDLRISHRRHSVRARHDAAAARARLLGRAARISHTAVAALGQPSVSPSSPASCSRRSSRSLFSAIRSCSPPFCSIGCSARRYPSRARRSRSAICFQAIAGWSSLIGFGSPNLGTVLVLGSFAVLAVETWRTRSSADLVDPACLLARRSRRCSFGP